MLKIREEEEGEDLVIRSRHSGGEYITEIWHPTYNSWITIYYMHTIGIIKTPILGTSTLKLLEKAGIQTENCRVKIRAK